MAVGVLSIARILLGEAHHHQHRQSAEKGGQHRARLSLAGTCSQLSVWAVISLAQITKYLSSEKLNNLSRKLLIPLEFYKQDNHSTYFPCLVPAFTSEFSNDDIDNKHSTDWITKLLALLINQFPN